VGSEPRPREDGRTVLKRLAALMDSFDEESPTLSLVELSRRADLPKSTTHRLAEQLRGLGWLERDHNGYRIGTRLFELGGLATQRTALRDAAFPHLAALASKTSMAVQLGVLDRGDVVYLERLLVAGYTLPTRLGGRMPAYCTALGKAMLAFDDTEADDVLAGDLPARTPNSITCPDELRARLAEVRAEGVAREVGEAVEGLACVAAPVRNSGRAIAAVSVTGPAERFDWPAVTEAVQQCAVAIWNARFGPAKSRAAV